MKRYGVLIAIIIAVTAQSGMAQQSDNPTRISLMSRYETHSNVNDGKGGFSGESYQYHMISVSKRLEGHVYGNVYYLNRYSLDDGSMITHAGGVNIIRALSPKSIFSLGYAYTSDPSRGTVTQAVRNDRDRFLFYYIHTMNPEEKIKPVYRLTTAFSTITNIGEQQAISEIVSVHFPKIARGLEADLSYNFGYSLRENEQLTNQYAGQLTYQITEKTKVSLGALYVDNVYTNNPGDDKVLHLSLYHNPR